MRAARGFKFPDNSWMNDGMQAIADGIRLMRCTVPFERITMCIPVSNYRAIKPKNYIGLIGFRKDELRISTNAGFDVEESLIDRGYQVNPGYFICPFRTGEIEITYLAIPVDEKGFPMIYDDADYVEAIRWKIITSLMEGGYAHPVFDYKTASQKWDEHSNRAVNSIKMTTVDQARRSGERWLQFLENQDYANINLDDYVDRSRLANNS
jgi:hypothetical protein